MTVPPTSATVQPIRYTSNVDGWLELVSALGGRTIVSDGLWHVCALPSGRLAIHGVDPHDPQAGSTQLRLAVPDITAALTRNADALAATGATATAQEAAHGLQGVVTGSDGMNVYLDAADPPTAADEVAPTGAAVLPLWMTPDVASAAAVLAALRLTRRITSDSGDWSDFTAPGGGLIAGHGGPLDVILSFEHPDLDELLAPLAEAGIRATVVDETYARTLRIANPDAPDDVDSEIWVNEAQRDLYGYSRA